MKIAKSVDSNKPNSTDLNNPKQAQAIAESMNKMAQQLKDSVHGASTICWGVRTFRSIV
jgi:hypothetical protein